ncbi:sel1 repeat family protein [Ancylobacter sp. VKM B-3255]|uniref:Sel1 repeat family protein n=2 Tax=Ancylobacter radicis TaxID=2836179 RepID=A0ABS5RBY2_9HYPH|nr:sel1 repeat family protein [Ancylobacter radicis]
MLAAGLTAPASVRAQDGPIQLPVYNPPPGDGPPGVNVPPPGGATPSKAPASIPLTKPGAAKSTTAKTGKSATPPDPAFAAYQRGRYKTALTLAVQRANAQGDPVAMVLAGEILSQGYGVRQDQAAAQKWYEAAAAKGNADALFTLGSLTLITGAPDQKDDGVTMLRAAAAKGNSAAAYNLGLIYLQGAVAPKEPATAAEWFKQAADADQPDAVYALATLYRDGNGVPKDPLESARLLARADDLGNVVATTELGILVFNGAGVPKDEARAAALFRKAALAGNPIAQNRYARILSAGRGVPQDKIAAAAWHLTAKAKKLDDPVLDKLVESLTPQERAAVDARLKLWQSPTAL